MSNGSKSVDKKRLRSTKINTTFWKIDNVIDLLKLKSSEEPNSTWKTKSFYLKENQTYPIEITKIDSKDPIQET